MTPHPLMSHPGESRSRAADILHLRLFRLQIEQPDPGRLGGFFVDQRLEAFFGQLLVLGGFWLLRQERQRIARR